MNKFRLMHRKKQYQKRLHNERVFIRTMIDCAIPKSKEEEKVRLNQKGSDFIFCNWSIHSGPYVNRHYRYTVDGFEYLSLYLLSIARRVFSFDIYIPIFLKNSVFVVCFFFHLSIVCSCMRKTNTKAHTNTLTHRLMCKVQAVHHLGQCNWWVCPTNNNW